MYNKHSSINILLTFPFIWGAVSGIFISFFIPIGILGFVTLRLLGGFIFATFVSLYYNKSSWLFMILSSLGYYFAVEIYMRNIDLWNLHTLLTTKEAVLYLLFSGAIGSMLLSIGLSFMFKKFDLVKIVLIIITGGILGTTFFYYYNAIDDLGRLDHFYQFATPFVLWQGLMFWLIAVLYPKEVVSVQPGRKK